jgi:hypothetical protein
MSMSSKATLPNDLWELVLAHALDSYHDDADRWDAVKPVIFAGKAVAVSTIPSY